MPCSAWSGNSEEWQKLVVQLLKLRYKLGDFVEVPDAVQGDCGLEGFGRDGGAFQCYAAEKPYDTKQLTTRQKNKVTTDLGKLQKNAVFMQGALGITKIRRWILVVPHWEDKQLQVHAQAKATELLSKGLSFLDPKFSQFTH